MRLSRPLLLLSAGHFCVDLYSSMFAAFLPFLQDRLDISLSQAGLLAGVLVFSTSLLQPLYGLAADRMRSKLFVALGPAIAAVFISSLGLAPDFRGLLILLVLGGVGVAAYHPQAAALTHGISRKNHALDMSIFVTAGTVGFALGPIYISAIVERFGVEQSYVAAIPGILLTLVLLFRGPSPHDAGLHEQPTPLREQLRGFVRPLAILYALVVIRSIISVGFSSFLPLFYTQQGYSPSAANQFLAVFLFAGGSAGLAGGLLADRFGGKAITAFSYVSSLPLFAGFLLTDGGLSVVFIAFASALLMFTGPVNIVMAQKLVPRGASTVAALMMGFAWGTAGLFVPLVGVAFEALGFTWTFAILSLLTAPGFALTLLLPTESRSERGAVRGVGEVETSFE